MLREARNAIRIENKSGRVSQVAIDPTETILQGDLLFWDTTDKVATKMTANTDAATFIGMSDHTNPQRTAGILTDDYSKPYVNVVQSGLVVLIAGFAETLYAFDNLEMVTDAQHVKKTSTPANVVAMVDPGWAGSAGKAVAIGDEIRCWLKVPSRYQVWDARTDPDVS